MSLRGVHAALAGALFCANVAAWAWAADAPQSTKCQTTDRHIDREHLEYLNWLGEDDLQEADCAPGRETYRAIIYGFHLTASGTSTRIDIDSSHAATAMLKET